jgi:hypothetical protein
MSHMVCPKIPHFLQMTLANQTSMVSSGFSSAMLEKTRGYPSKIWLMSATFNAWDKAPSPYQAVERASRFVDTVYNAQWTYIYIMYSLQHKNMILLRDDIRISLFISSTASLHNLPPVPRRHRRSRKVPPWLPRRRRCNVEEWESCETRTHGI